MIFALPTDTCYGIAGDLSSHDIDHIYRLKHRSKDKQLALLVRDIDMLREYAELSGDMIRFLEGYSRPWSIVLRPKKTMVFPPPLNSYETISFRVASFCLQKAFLGDIPMALQGWDQDFPYVLTSANTSGQPEAHTLSEVYRYFPDLIGIDGGVCNNPPSDIFSLSSEGEPTFFRRFL